VSGLNGTKSSSGCTYMVPIVDYNGETLLIGAAGVDKIDWMVERTLPPKLRTMFPELAGKTANLRGRKGNMDILIGLDNLRRLPCHVSNKDQSPINYRLMKSKFGKRSIVIGSSQARPKPRKTKRLIHTTLGGFRKGMMALVLLLVAASPGKQQEVCWTGGDGDPGARTSPTGCGCNRPCGGPANPREFHCGAPGPGHHDHGADTHTQVLDGQRMVHSLLRHHVIHEVAKSPMQEA
jgi:hypothetical protein